MHLKKIAIKSVIVIIYIYNCVFVLLLCFLCLGLIRNKNMLFSSLELLN